MPNLTLDNLMETHLSTDFIYAKYAFGIIIALFIGSFILSYIRKNAIHHPSFKKALKPMIGNMRWISALMLVITWARLEGVPYLSMRLWWLLLFFFCLFIVFRVWRRYISYEVARLRYEREGQEHEKILKYLPKKKKRK